MHGITFDAIWGKENDNGPSWHKSWGDESEFQLEMSRKAVTHGCTFYAILGKKRYLRKKGEIGFASPFCAKKERKTPLIASNN